jgi:WD40 repeat protein
MTSASTLIVNDQNPWPGLSAFDEASEQFFNGRSNETVELRRLVLNAPLTILFGASGLGKTSLIQAGLFPLLRKERYLPVYVRLDVRDRGALLIDQVSFAFLKQVRAQRVDAPSWQEQESLWEYLHRPSLELWSAQNQLLTPLFVFDQFEEVCTLGAENASAIRQLRIDLANLIENRVPDTLARSIHGNGAVAATIAFDRQRYKVLLSFREDYLPALEGWKRDLPSILRNRLRLLPMSRERAFEAVYKTAPRLVNEELAREIVQFVSGARNDATGIVADAVTDAGELTIEPALLSLVCNGLNEKRKAQGKARFDEELLAGSKESIIADYYRNALNGMPATVRRFIQEELITGRGFRKPCDVDDAQTKHGVTAQQLSLLVDRRLLRMEPFRGTERVELTHDLLTGVVREQRDRERARVRARRQLRRAVVAVSAVLALAAPIWWFRHRGLLESAQAQKERAQVEEREREQEIERKEQSERDKDARNIEKAKDEVLAEQSEIERHLADEAIREKKVAILAMGASKALSSQQFDLALLLAIESTRNGDTSDGRGSLLSALQSTSNLRSYIRDHAAPVTSLAFHGNKLISVDSAGKILTHDDGGSPLGQSVNVAPGRFTISPDGTFLASASPGTVTLCNMSPETTASAVSSAITSCNADGAGLKLQEVASAPSTPIALSGDGKSAAWISPQGKSVTLWNLADNRDCNLKLEFAGRATAIALSRDATKLALWLQDSIVVWDIHDVSDPPKPAILKANPQGIRVLQFDPKDRFLAYATPDGGVGLWDLKSPQPQVITQNWRASSLAFSSDGAWMASGSATGEVGIWRVGATQPMWSQHLHPAAVTSVAFSVDSKMLVSSGGSQVALSNVAPQSLGRVLTGSLAPAVPDARIAFTADKHVFAYGVSPLVTDRKGEKTGGEGYVRVWNTSNISEPESHDWDGHGRSALALSPNGQIALLGARSPYASDGCRISDVHLMRTTDGKDLLTPLFEGETASAMVFTPDSRQLVLATCKVSSSPSGNGAKRYQIVHWSVERHENEGSVFSTEDLVTALAISPDGKLLAAAVLDEPPKIKLWNLESKASSSQLDLLGELPVSNLLFSPDSKSIVSVGSDGTLILSRLSDRKQLAHLSGGLMTDLAFSPDGRTLASGKFDGSIVLWDMQTSRQIGALRQPGALGPASVAFNPKDSGLLASATGSTVTLWNIESANWKTQACHIANRNLSFPEWQQYGEGSYLKTCPEVPVHPSVLQHAGDLARQGDEAAARTLFQRAKDLDHLLHFDPSHEVAVARAQGAAMSGRRLVRTKPLEALQDFHSAEEIDPIIVSANDWNSVCWFGSIQGFARQVLTTCEKAVNKMPNELGYIDSRGLARALTGDTQGAISDFTAFLRSDRAESLKQQRQDWIKKLNADQNPFTPQVLRSLENQ